MTLMPCHQVAYIICYPHQFAGTYFIIELPRSSSVCQMQLA